MIRRLGRSSAYRQVLAALVAIAAPICRLLHIRVYQSNLHRIGDSNMEVGGYIRRRTLGWVGCERPVIIPSPQARRPANTVSLQYLSEHVRVIRNPWLYPFLFRLCQKSAIGGALFDHQAVPAGNRLAHWQATTAAQRFWEEQRRPALLTLKCDHERLGRSVLRTLGLPADAWFVCLHGREPGFLRESPASHHRQKSVDIATYLPAALRIVERGGWVIRVGDPTMKRLPALGQVIDYAHLPVKSEWMDVFLAASCRFWLGSNSGLYLLAQNFGTPVAMANLFPASNRPWTRNDLFIAKPVYDSSQQRQLSFNEMLAAELLYEQEYEARGYEAIDNTAEEITELIDEMLDRLDGIATYTPEDEDLQERYNAIAASYWYPYGISGRIGRDFLRHHANAIT